MAYSEIELEEEVPLAYLRFGDDDDGAEGGEEGGFEEGKEEEEEEEEEEEPGSALTDLINGIEGDDGEVKDLCLLSDDEGENE